MGLAKILQVLDAEVVAELVSQGVLQDAAVTVAQDETVAVAPLGIGRVVAQDRDPRA